MSLLNIGTREHIGDVVSSEITYRTAESSDIARIAAMHVSGTRAGITKLVADRDPRHRLYCDKVAALLAQEPEGLIVAEQGGEVVGFIQASRDLAALRRQTATPRALLGFALRALAGRYGWDTRSWRRACRRLFTFLGAGRRAIPDPKANGPAQPAARPAQKTSGRAGHVVSMVVLEEMRRRGIATALLDRSLEYLRACGCEEVRLEVAAPNAAARATYARYGFAERSRYRDMNCEWVVMGKPVA